MIQFDQLEKRYPEFDLRLDLEIPEGRLVSILGPSGSGKTTTLRLVGGFERPDQGRVVVGDVDVTGMPPAERNIGFVFQDYTLFPHMNVAQNIGYGLHTRGYPRSDISERVDELLGFVQLRGYGRRRVQTLSGGEMQRVAVARALAIKPNVLVLDEPFSAIDTPLRRDLREEIVRLQRDLGITTVFVTHSQEEALSISDAVIVMRQGRVEQYASPHELYERPANRFVASFAGAANFIPARISTLGARDITVDAFREFSVAYPQAGPAPSGGPGSIGQTRLGGWSATSVRNRWSGPRLREGEQVTVMVRPNKLKRARLGARNAFEATVSSRQYFAHYYEYRCRCDGLAFTLFDPAEYAVGETLRLTFDPEDAVLLDE